MVEQLFNNLEELVKVRANITKESDRGCVLLAVSYLDNELKNAIEARLVENKAVVNDMLGTGRPLGTFSSRIDMAYLLGIISFNQRRQLHLIRKIRNEFGHSYEEITFDTDNIKNRIQELDFNKFVYDDIRAKFIKEVLQHIAILIGYKIDFNKIEEKKDKEIDCKEVLEKLSDDVMNMLVDIFTIHRAEIEKDVTMKELLLSNEFRETLLKDMQEKMKILD